MSTRLTAEQRHWCESMMGKTLRESRYMAGNTNGPRGVVLDYKPDLTGKGCFFIVQFGKRKKRTAEIHRQFPAELRVSLVGEP